MRACERTEPTETGSKAIPKMRTCNFIEICGILINMLHHGPSKMVTMISRSNDLEFVKTWVNNEEGVRREEGRGEGGGRQDLQNLHPELLTYQEVARAHFRDGFRTCLQRFGPLARPDFTFSPIDN